MSKQVRVDHKAFIDLVRQLIEQGHANPLKIASERTGVHPGTAGRICRQAGLNVSQHVPRKTGMLRIVREILYAKPGTTLEDIGNRMKPPVSRQRVQQIREEMKEAGFIVG